MTTNARRILCAAALIALPLAACGDDDGADTGSASGSGSGSGSGTEEEAGLTVTAKDSLQFDASDYSAAAGTIEVYYENDGALPHTLVVEGHEDAMKLSVSGGGDTDEGSIDLEAGEY